MLNRNTALPLEPPADHTPFLKVFFFISLGGLLWWIANAYMIAEPEGFDPLRYEYFARYGLPEAFEDSSSYRMVALLAILYKIFPYYIGYLLFIGITCLIVINSDKNLITKIVVFTPVSFYYLAQTGKDGIAILAIASMAALTCQPKGILYYIPLGLTVILGIFIRPAILLLLPIVFTQFKLGTKWAALSTFAVGIAFYLSVDSYDILNHLEGLTDDEGAGRLAAIMRYYSFGYEWEPVLYKIVLLGGSLVFQPAIGVVKYLSGSGPFVLLEGGCFLAFLLLLLKNRVFFKFLISSIPYVIIIGISSPFYHFRYLAVAYPVIYAFCMSVDGFGWKRPQFLEKQPQAVRGTT